MPQIILSILVSNFAFTISGWSSGAYKGPTNDKESSNP